MPGILNRLAAVFAIPPVFDSDYLPTSGQRTGKPENKDRPPVDRIVGGGTVLSEDSKRPVVGRSGSIGLIPLVIEHIPYISHLLLEVHLLELVLYSLELASKQIVLERRLIVR